MYEPPASKVTESPAQNEVGPLAVIPGVGLAFTVTDCQAMPVHPPLFVTVTVSVLVVVTVMVRVVAPVFQLYDVYEPASKVTELPEQKVVAPPGVMPGEGLSFTVTVVVPAEPVQVPNVAVTE